MVKCSARDLPVALVHGRLGATTVAATLAIATRAGIRVMATGGFGGVHRGGERSLDVSADLDQLARSPVAVVCSGAKSILDQPRTMERLETIGVTVVGFGCSELPGFYTTGTGLPVPRIDTVSNLCRLLEAQRNLGLPGAVVVAQPPPAELALDRTTADHLLRGAEEAACLAGIHGPLAHAVPPSLDGGAERRRRSQAQSGPGAGQCEARRARRRNAGRSGCDAKPLTSHLRSLHKTLG